MASSGTKGYGSKLSYAAGPPYSSYTDIAQTVDLAGPEPEVGDIDITNNDSPNNTKEYIPGLIEPGEQSFDVVFKKSVCAALYTLFGDGLIYGFRETFPDGSKWEYTGYWKSFGTETETDDGLVRNTISIKLTSKPVFTAGA